MATTSPDRLVVLMDELLQRAAGRQGPEQRAQVVSRLQQAYSLLADLLPSDCRQYVQSVFFTMAVMLKSCSPLTSTRRSKELELALRCSLVLWHKAAPRIVPSAKELHEAIALYLCVLQGLSVPTVDDVDAETRHASVEEVIVPWLQCFQCLLQRVSDPCAGALILPCTPGC